MRQHGDGHARAVGAERGADQGGVDEHAERERGVHRGEHQPLERPAVGASGRSCAAQPGRLRDQDGGEHGGEQPGVVGEDLRGGAGPGGHAGELEPEQRPRVGRPADPHDRGDAERGGCHGGRDGEGGATLLGGDGGHRCSTPWIACRLTCASVERLVPGARPASPRWGISTSGARRRSASGSQRAQRGARLAVVAARDDQLAARRVVPHGGQDALGAAGAGAGGREHPGDV